MKNYRVSEQTADCVNLMTQLAELKKACAGLIAQMYGEEEQESQFLNLEESAKSLQDYICRLAAHSLSETITAQVEINEI